MPKMIINIAENSRVDSGYRLLERCVQHGHDPKMHSIFYSTAKLIEVTNGSLCLVLEAKVPASMRDKVYNAKMALTAEDVLSVECDCKAGSKHEDGVVCVHSPVLPYKVTELLLEDMAEHLLLELASCLVSLDTDEWSLETMADVKESVVILM